MIRTGIGYDAHQLGYDYPLIIGGVKIPSKKGSIGHSDGDVLSHSIVDAMLGSLSLGDIGKYFPSSEQKWKDKSSLFFLKKANQLIIDKGYKINNIDSTIILQEPKISNYVQKIIKKISSEIHITSDNVSVKLTTKDMLGFHKNSSGIEALAIITVSN